MSLITDALRQASQTDRQQAEKAPPPLPPAPAPPAPPLLRNKPASPWPTLVGLLAAVVLGLVALGVGGFWFYKTRAAQRPDMVVKSSAPSQTVLASVAAKPAPARAPKPSALPSTLAPPIPSVPTNAPAATVLAAMPKPVASAPISNAPAVVVEKPAPAAPPALQWPRLRLQGIYYRPPNSSVVINNKTLYVDEEIQGVKVAQIERRGVTLLLEGQTNTLFLR